MSDFRVASMIAVMSGVTVLIRFAPFWVFRPGRPVPAIVNALGSLLPGAVMTMLVVYCLRGVSFVRPPHALPEMIASAVTVGLHVWRRSTLLSILGGTVCYMVLVQTVFL